jgi:hypothetical protein
MNTFRIRIFAVSLALVAGYVWAECPKTAPFSNACTAEIAICGGTLYPVGGCAQRTEVDVQKGPFACATVGQDTQCLDGQPKDTMRCFIRFACIEVPGRGCRADGTTVTESQDRVIKVQRACNKGVSAPSI